MIWVRNESQFTLGRLRRHYCYLQTPLTVLNRYLYFSLRVLRGIIKEVTVKIIVILFGVNYKKSSMHVKQLLYSLLGSNRHSSYRRLSLLRRSSDVYKPVTLSPVPRAVLARGSGRMGKWCSKVPITRIWKRIVRQDFLTQASDKLCFAFFMHGVWACFSR